MNRAWLEKQANRLWYGRQPLARLLSPLALAYCGAVTLRRLCYRRGWLPVHDAGVPVVVVGNITTGGTGKTPLVIWLAGLLRRAGYRVGIVTRGYGGRARARPRIVHADSDPLQVGDEAVLLASRTGCPVMSGVDRVAAVQHLRAGNGCSLVISDDGLQHYRLGRTVEIAVTDGDRGLGNGLCLPAGPLREPASRLHSVDFHVINGSADGSGWRMRMQLNGVRPLAGGGATLSLDSFRQSQVHAVAGIGHPQRFFDMLRAAGLQVIEHAFPDHHVFSAAELDFGDGLPVLMTDKDAVKCRRFDTENLWSVSVEAVPDPDFGAALLARLQRTH